MKRLLNAISTKQENTHGFENDASSRKSFRQASSSTSGVYEVEYMLIVTAVCATSSATCDEDHNDDAQYETVQSLVR